MFPFAMPCLGTTEDGSCGSPAHLANSPSWAEATVDNLVSRKEQWSTINCQPGGNNQEQRIIPVLVVPQCKIKPAFSIYFVLLQAHAYYCCDGEKASQSSISIN
jgi:hypothetical protein